MTTNATTSPELFHAIIRADFDAWRDVARRLLASNVAPERVVWSDDRSTDVLPIGSTELPADAGSTHHVPREFVESAHVVACHRDPVRWSLLYRILFRLTHGQTGLLEDPTDDDVLPLRAMERSVGRDCHKMTAFVRFRLVHDDAGEHYVAYHTPEHYVVKLAAPFFRERFGLMRWTIFTPDDSVRWDGHNLSFGPGVSRDAAPTGDQLESLWLTYYRSIFNPARVKVKAMKKEMPQKYWSTMPETALIPELLAQASPRVQAMTPEVVVRNPEADPRSLPSVLNQITSLPQLAKEAAKCRICDWADKCTQTVFGEGPVKSAVIFVGEQPGDMEDREGRPFVGPAGQLFQRVLDEVGIDRKRVYVTNAVKHFKFEQRGKRRIHQTPTARDAANCRPWLERELGIIQPSMLVCLGATAARSLLGNGFRITQSRGEVIKSDHAPWTIATWHPSALLRVPDPAQQRAMEEQFAEDLRLVAKKMTAA
ncbi:MAG: UdgX family uracil-DNA binding protein [Tepidisphaeraceae bacterium]